METPDLAAHPAVLPGMAVKLHFDPCSLGETKTDSGAFGQANQELIIAAQILDDPLLGPLTLSHGTRQSC